jgi:hypothetical protein
MAEQELIRQVRQLRAEGRTPKQIARALQMRPAAVAPLVRAIAAGQPTPDEPPVVGCWVSPGWSNGLIIEQQPDWPVADGGSVGGLVTVLVARRHQRDKVSACCYLVDAYCLGVKNTIGPRIMGEVELRRFLRDCFSGYASAPLPTPLDLAQHLVLGAVDYARQFGFQPPPDFPDTRGHLGSFTGPSAIRFGHNGKPSFVQGPYDNARKILRTLDATVGPGNYEFTVVAG